MEIIKIALSALKTNKTRSFLTMLGIIIGISSVILLMSIGNGLQTYVVSQFESLGANSLFVIPGTLQGSTSGRGSQSAPKFTLRQIEDIKREVPTVTNVMAEVETSGKVGYLGKSVNTQITGVGANYTEVQSQKAAEGVFFNLSQYNSAKKVAVLGKTVKNKLFGEESPVGKKITVSDQRFIVVGVLEEKGAFGSIDADNVVLIPTTTAMRQFSIDHVQSIVAQSESNQTINQTKQGVEKVLLKTLKADDFTVLDTKSLLKTITQVLSVITLALSSIAAISLIVGGVGIMNIMLVSVTERTREIGLRKAVGATPRDILTQFLVEALILAFLGGLVGITIGAGGSLIISKFFTTTVTPVSVLLAFGVSALVGVIFGVAPAAKAARLNPIDALRYE